MRSGRGVLPTLGRHIALALPLVVWALAACEGCRSTQATTPAAPPGSAADAGPPTARLYFVTDLAGALEPCGCTKDQLGGLDHFAAWAKGGRAGGSTALVASAGPLFFMDDKLEGERADQDRLKALTIAQVLHSLGFAAFAPGANDWDDGPEGLKKLAGTAGGATIDGTGSSAVREVGGLKIGFVGFGQSAAPQEIPDRAVEEAVKRGVGEAKERGANVLVALASVGRGEAKRIADAVPELTAIVVGSSKASGDANTSAPQGEQVGDVLIVQAANHLQSVAVLDLYVRQPPLDAARVVKFADGTGLELSRKREDLAQRVDDLHVKIASWERDPIIAPRDVESRREDLRRLEAERDALDQRPPPAQGNFFRYSVVEIRESLGKDPAIDALLGGYYKVVDEHNRIAFAGRLPVPARPDQASYVGIDACSKCHEAARAVWDKTSHSGAYATLSAQFKEFNLECVGCHVTGYERPGGSTVAHVDPLRNVQCEACHGPGSQHVLDPTDKTRILARPQASRCLECHHPPHVESFDTAAKMKEILGPGHGMPVR